MPLLTTLPLLGRLPRLGRLPLLKTLLLLLLLPLGRLPLLLLLHGTLPLLLPLPALNTLPPLLWLLQQLVRMRLPLLSMMCSKKPAAAMLFVWYASQAWARLFVRDESQSSTDSASV